MLDCGDDESGLFMKYLRRGSGYYIDVGASQLIIDGDDQAGKSGVNVKAITETARGARRRHANCRPTSSSTPPATAR